MSESPADFYKSPLRSRALARVEDSFLSDDDSWWTGHRPSAMRIVAEVPRALYLNFLVRKSHVAGLSPELFRPLDVPGDSTATLFTILVFVLEGARPLWAPSIFSALAPRILQSNWRFYGYLTEPESEARQGVLFIRTVTTSLALSAFGRRLARCFPLRRARHMKLEWAAPRLTAAIDPGSGSAPEFEFEGEQTESSQVADVFRNRFPSYESYARWIVDQHLSLVIWPKEYVVQDMHLNFDRVQITPLRSLKCRISGLQDLAGGDVRPIDSFVVEGLKVFLDSVCAVPNHPRK